MPKLIINGRFLTQRITGVQRFAIELLKELLKITHEIKVLVPNKKILTHIDADILQFGSKNDFIWEQIDLPLFLTRNLHKDDDFLNLTGLGPIFFRRKIHFVHDIIVLTHPQYFSCKYRLLYKFLMPLTIRNSTFLISSSEYTKKQVNHHLKISLNNIHVIQGAPFITFTEKYKRLIDEKYILCVSSRDPRKNFNWLIRTISGIKDFKLLVAVAGSKMSSFADDGLVSSQYVLELGYVSDEDLAALYAHAEYFIYPSVVEGFGLPPLEAMSMGCPVICSNRASLPEVCGDAAIYIDPENDDALIKVLLDINRNLIDRDALIYKGFSNVKNFSWKFSANKLSEIIRSYREVKSE